MKFFKASFLGLKLKYSITVRLLIPRVSAISVLLGSLETVQFFTQYIILVIYVVCKFLHSFLESPSFNHSFSNLLTSILSLYLFNVLQPNTSKLYLFTKLHINGEDSFLCRSISLCSMNRSSLSNGKSLLK